MNKQDRQWIAGLVVFIVLLLGIPWLIPIFLILIIVYLLQRLEILHKYTRLPNAQTFIRYLREDIQNIFQGVTKTKATHTSYTSNIKQRMQTIDPRKKRKLGKWILFTILFFVALSFIGSFWVVVDAGYTGVRSLFGKVYDREFSSGFHLKNPFVKVTQMNIRTQEYTMSIATGEGNRYGADAITALTKEGLSVDLDITVLYNLVEDKASDVYRDVGFFYDEVIIRPQIRSVIREVIAEYEAKDIYSEKRQEATGKILSDLKASLDPRGIEVEEVLLRNVKLPEDLSQSIQQKLQAEQDAERYDFILERERKEAERKRVEAEGQRDAQQIINQSLSQQYLQYLYINSLENREGTIYVPTNPSNGTPLFRGL